jgi:hypothetical protein
VGLVVESQIERLGVDDIRLTTADAVKPADRLRKLAFEARDARSAEADGVLVSTDATDGFAEADLLRTLGHMRRARAMIGRLFGDAVRPMGPPNIPALLIFKDPAAAKAFWQRMGEQWSVDIVPSTSGGYTVQDIATSTYDPAKGPDRPVYLHEAVHAVLSHDVRLFTNNERHWWLHEACANYVQLSVYPKSLPPDVLATQFQKGVADNGLFIPLSRLLAKRGTERNYVQLAVLMAYLVDKHPDWLPKIARTLSADGTIADALQACGTTFDDLETAWLQWGRERFIAPREDHVDLPVEWRKNP